MSQASSDQEDVDTGNLLVEIERENQAGSRDVEGSQLPLLQPVSRYTPPGRARAVRRRLDRVAQVLDAAPAWLSVGCLSRLDGALSGFLDVVREEFRRSGSRSERPGSAPGSRTPSARFYTETKVPTPERVGDRIRRTREVKERKAREQHNI